MINLQARADLRAAIKRLLAAARTKESTATVRPEDIDLLLALVQTRVLADTPVAPPRLDPRQR